MRIFTDIASHDTSGVAPGGRITRTDSTPEAGGTTPVNGKWVFTVPEGAALEVDENSYWFPMDANSIPAQTAAEFLIRYPMYDHILYNFYIDNEDVTGLDTTAFATFPAAGNTTPAYTDPLVPPSAARCQLGRGAGAGDVGMVPNSLAILPKSEARTSNVYGCVITAAIDLWQYNPCYIDVAGAVVAGSTITIAGVLLTAINGAAGVDQFDISSGVAATITTNIINAINLGSNSFSTFVTATVDPTVPTRIQLRPVPATNTTVTLTATGTNLSVVQSHPGTDEVMLWWKASTGDVTEDQGFAAQGPGAGTNTPAIKSQTEADPDVSALLVYASVDNGVNWSRVSFLTPVDLTNAGTQLRLCFVNRGSTKRYLHGFAVLFPDLLAPL